MKTIEIKIYSFEELSEDAREKAIEQVRQQYYEFNEFAHWAIDDCSLFEPPHDELTELAKKNNRNYNFPLIENTREKIYFDTGRGSFLDCENAMHITDEDLFLDWLGISEDLRNDDGFYWSIKTPSHRGASTTISIDCDNYDKFEGEIDEAIEKFEDHVGCCLDRIEADIDYRFTDIAIEEDIKANDMEFTEDGTIY